MATFWFISAPLPGHLDWGGLLKTAQVLRARGHAVTWVSEAPIERMVSAAGVPFAAVPQTGWRWPPPPLPPAGPGDDQQALRYRRALDTWLDVERVRAGVEALRSLVERQGRPDLIVSDPFLAAAAVAAEAVNVPFVVGGWASGAPLDEDDLLAIQRELGQEARARLERLCDRFGVRGTNFSDGPAPSVQSPRLHISYFNAYWHQDDQVLSQTEFVGGSAPTPQSAPPAWLSDIPAGQPLGVVTLGSTFTGDLAFFAHGARAAAQSGMVPVVIIGYQPLTAEQKQALKRNLPGGTRLLNWAPFEHVLPRAGVIVQHGGMGTTHAAVLHAIPQVITPHAGDQRGQARRARQAKVGLEISIEEVQQGQLLPAVQAITTTPFVREAVDHLAREFAALGGAPRAADLLEQVSRETSGD